VFVHGLNPRGRSDHPYETWRHQNGTFWPRDYLPQDIPHARVFVYGYNSNVTNPQAMSTASVKDHANTLLNLLDMERSPQLVCLGLFTGCGADDGRIRVRRRLCSSGTAWGAW
jgi:hypothetical protein